MDSLPQFEEYGGPLWRGQSSAEKGIGGIGFLKGIEDAHYLLHGHNSILRRFRALSSKVQSPPQAGESGVAVKVLKDRIAMDGG